MRILLRTQDRQPLYSVEVPLKSPPAVVKDPRGAGPQVSLNWDEAFQDDKHLRRCPVCGCRELFMRKDFPQVTGFLIVAAAVVFSMILYGHGQLKLALGVLVLVALIDLLVFFFTSRCLVCYRCRSEFRDLPIARDHPGWELAVGEKYRQQATSPRAEEPGKEA